MSLQRSVSRSRLGRLGQLGRLAGGLAAGALNKGARQLLQGQLLPEPLSDALARLRNDAHPMPLGAEDHTYCLPNYGSTCQCVIQSCSC